MILGFTTFTLHPAAPRDPSVRYGRAPAVTSAVPSGRDGSFGQTGDAEPGRPLRRLAVRARRSGARSRSFAGQATSATSAAATTRRFTRTLLDEVALRHARRRRARRRPDATHPKVTRHRGRAARRRWRGVADALARRRALHLGARAPLGAATRRCASSAASLRPGGVCVGQRPVVARQARPRALGLPARPQPGRGDGRPQDVLRPARPLAAARAGRLPPHADPLLQAQVRPQHVRRLPAPTKGARELHRRLPRRDRADRRGARPRRDRAHGRPGSPRCATRGGRLFILGVGGSAGHASHAVNDFRKICGIEAYAPTDNVSELTARINDEGWDTTLLGVARGLAPRRRATRCSSSRSAAADASKNVSANLVARARARPRSAGAPVFGIVGRDGGAHRAARRRLRRHPAAVRRPHHAAHRGSVRRRLAPAGQPPGAGRARRPSGSRCSVTRSAAPRLHRRRRRLHRQPLRRPPARRPGGAERSRVYDNFSSGRRVAPRAARGDAAAARRRAATSSDLDALAAAMDGPRRRHPPRLQPRHRRARRPSRRSTSTRAPCSPTTSSRRCATRRRRADPLRLRQRRLRRSRRARGATRTTARCVPVVDLRREQARRRGAASRPTPTCSASPAAPSASATSSARARPTASASTSSAGCSPTRRRLRILGDGTQSKSYIHVDDVVDAVLLAQRAGRRRRSTSSTSRPATTSPSPRSPSSPSSASASRPGASTFEYTGGDRGWKGDVPIVRLATERIRALGWTNERTGRARRCAHSMRHGRRLPGRGGSGALVTRTPRPSSSTATACSTARRCATARPYPPRDAGRARAAARASPRPARGCATPGFVLVVVTNQPDIARGTLAAADRRAPCNERLPAGCRVDEIVVCPHDDGDDCACRKPRPGMLLDAAERRRLDLDAQRHGRRPLARRRGRPGGPACRTVSSTTDYDERAPEAPDAVVAGLPEAGASWSHSHEGETPGPT